MKQGLTPPAAQISQAYARRLEFHRLGRVLCLFTLVGLISGCGKISIEVNKFKKPFDFLKTEIISSGPVPADGTSEMLLAVHLKNSDNSSVPEYRPEYEIVTGSGVSQSNCTTSDQNGISACILKANVPGPKILRLTNAKVGLERTVVFTPIVRSGVRMGIVSASNQNMTSAGGYKAEISLGEKFKNIKSVTNGGYEVRMSVQGILVSR